MQCSIRLDAHVLEDTDKTGYSPRHCQTPFCECVPSNGMSSHTDETPIDRLVADVDKERPTTSDQLVSVCAMNLATGWKTARAKNSPVLDGAGSGKVGHQDKVLRCAKLKECYEFPVKFPCPARRIPRSSAGERSSLIWHLCRPHQEGMSLLCSHLMPGCSMVSLGLIPASLPSLSTIIRSQKLKLGAAGRQARSKWQRHVCNSK